VEPADTHTYDPHCLVQVYPYMGCNSGEKTFSIVAKSNFIQHWTLMIEIVECCYFEPSSKSHREHSMSLGPA
jgi:hypothetical protein